MTIHNISNTGDWGTVAGTSLVNGDLVNLSGSFAFSSQPTLMTLPEGVTFDGHDHTITFDFASLQGIFVMNGGTIQSLKIDGNANTCLTNEGLFVNYATGGANQWGHFSGCTATNAILGSYGGGVTCYNFGNTSNKSTIDKCASDVTVGLYGGGLAARYVKYIDISNSYFDGISSGVRSGGIMGDGAGGYNTTVNIDNCWSNFDKTQTMACGICGGSGTSSTINIRECYSIGDMSGYWSAGIIGPFENTGVILIENCYVIGNITNDGAGFATGPSTYSTTQSCIIRQSYHLGTVNPGGASVIAQLSGSGTCSLENCVVANTSYSGQGKAVSVVNSTTDYTTIENGNLPAEWSGIIWSGVSGSEKYPILETFTDVGVWGGTYASHDDTPILQQSEPEPEPEPEGFSGGDMIELVENTLQKGRIIKTYALGLRRTPVYVVKWVQGSQYTPNTKRMFIGNKITMIQPET